MRCGLRGARQLRERDHGNRELLASPLSERLIEAISAVAVLDPPPALGQLQVVHDHQAQAVLGFEAAALGPHLERRDGGRSRR